MNVEKWYTVVSKNKVRCAWSHWWEWFHGNHWSNFIIFFFLFLSLSAIPFPFFEILFLSFCRRWRLLPVQELAWFFYTLAAAILLLCINMFFLLNEGTWRSGISWSFVFHFIPFSRPIFLFICLSTVPVSFVAISYH